MNHTDYWPDIPRRVEIEQAIARGESDETILAELGVTPGDIADTNAWLDAVAAEIETVHVTALGRITGRRAPLSPHGTHAAFVRHKQRGETPCEQCAAGERGYQAERYRRRKQLSA